MNVEKNYKIHMKLMGTSISLLHPACKHIIRTKSYQNMGIRAASGQQHEYRFQVALILSGSIRHSTFHHSLTCMSCSKRISQRLQTLKLWDYTILTGPHKITYNIYRKAVCNFVSCLLPLFSKTFTKSF